MDIENHLKQSELEIKRELELQRILKCHPKDSFAILQINPLRDLDTLASQVKKLFRQKSLLLHPDKVKHPDAPQAFDLVKKAELVLSATGDDSRVKERENLVDLYVHLDVTGEGKVAAYDSATNETIREKVHNALESHDKQQEVETSYQQRQDAQRHKEAANSAKERELKKQWDKEWEAQRDGRVKLWRDFSAKVTKKKKPKRKVLA